MHGRASTTQTASDLAAVRADIAANAKRQAEASAEFKRISAPRINDVASMSPDEALSRLTQLKALTAPGGLNCVRANAVNGDQKTTSVETYMAWLDARAAAAGSSPLPPTPLSMSVSSCARRQGNLSVHVISGAFE